MYHFIFLRPKSLKTNPLVEFSFQSPTNSTVSFGGISNWGELFKTNISAQNSSYFGVAITILVS